MAGDLLVDRERADELFRRLPHDPRKRVGPKGWDWRAEAL
jgi:hypothetical protein